MIYIILIQNTCINQSLITWNEPKSVGSIAFIGSGLGIVMFQPTITRKQNSQSLFFSFFHLSVCLNPKAIWILYRYQQIYIIMYNGYDDFIDSNNGKLTK